MKRSKPRQARKQPEDTPATAPEAFAYRRQALCFAALGLASVALLIVSFAPFDIWPAGYVALSGWIVMVALRPGRSTPLLAWAAGALYWLITLYWLWWITLVGYFALVFYLSAYWLAGAWLLRRARKRRVPMWLAFAVFWVALEYARAHVISGFPWFFLAQTQYRNTLLIQIAAVTGQYGVSFLVAMCNGLVADLVIERFGGRSDFRKAVRRRILPGLAVTVAALGSCLIYGWVQTAREPAGPRVTVGVVQRAYPISLTEPGRPSVEVFDEHYTDSLDLIRRNKARGRRMDLLVWPETMLPAGLNKEFLEIDPARLSDAHAVAFFTDIVHQRPSPDQARKWLAETLEIRKEYRDLLRKLARRGDCTVLAGGLSYHLDPQEAGPGRTWVVRNSALVFPPDQQEPGTYSKMHLVPFSEFVPFKKSLPCLHRLLRSFVPPVMTQLDGGDHVRRFAVGSEAVQSPPVRIASAICYEGTFARVCRRLVYDSDGGKRADVLVNISNDGWFVWPGGRRGTTEQAQHLSHYVFRAIENRVPVVRAVNTGISAFIDSRGRIGKVVRETRQGRDRAVMAEATGAAGITLDSRKSFFSLVGDAFAIGVSLVAVLMCGWWLARGATGKEKESQDAQKSIG